MMAFTKRRDIKNYDERASTAAVDARHVPVHARGYPAQRSCL